jgi:hypothetical protein
VVPHPFDFLDWIAVETALPEPDVQAWQSRLVRLDNRLVDQIVALAKALGELFRGASVGHVQEDRSKLGGQERPQRFLAASRLDKAIVGRSEDAFQGPQFLRLVVHQQDACGGGAHRRRLGRVAHPCTAPLSYGRAPINKSAPPGTTGPRSSSSTARIRPDGWATSLCRKAVKIHSAKSPEDSRSSPLPKRTCSRSRFFHPFPELGQECIARRRWVPCVAS